MDDALHPFLSLKQQRRISVWLCIFLYFAFFVVQPFLLFVVPEVQWYIDDWNLQPWPPVAFAIQASKWLKGTLWPYQDYRGLFIVGPVLFLALVVASVWHWRVGKHLKHEEVGLCVACGYDVKASIAMGTKTCPECGAIIALPPDPSVAQS
ncbi:MAG: hypothetical protein K8S99_07880 [Planctomycetes bacterium]|nr:hypothetical protein [Planctomycetota bacterium]